MPLFGSPFRLLMRLPRPDNFSVDDRHAEQNSEQAERHPNRKWLTENQAADEYADGRLEIAHARGSQAADRSEEPEVYRKTQGRRDNGIDQQGDNGGTRG